MSIEKINSLQPKERKKEIEDPIQLFEELKKTREEAKNLLEELFSQYPKEESFERYFRYFNRDIERYITSLDDKEVKKVAQEIKEKILESTEIWKVFKEFNIDPLGEDLSKQNFIHPVTFKSQILFDNMKRPLIEHEGTAGYYNLYTDEVIIYTSGDNKENNKILKQYLVSLENPRDLKRRIEVFLKHNCFTDLVYTILHELIHVEQGRNRSSFQEIGEAQSSHEVLFVGLRNEYSLSKQISSLGHTISSKEVEEILKSLKEEKEGLKAVSQVSGISEEAILKFFEKAANLRNFQIEKKDRYQFNKERLMNSFIVLQRLRALDYSEREIAHLISKYGDDWNSKTYRFEELEDFIEEEMKKRGLEVEDLDQLANNYQIKRKIDFNKSYIKKLNFLKEKVFKKD